MIRIRIISTELRNTLFFTNFIKVKHRDKHTRVAHNKTVKTNFLIIKMFICTFFLARVTIN